MAVLAAATAMSMFAFTMVHAGITDLTSYKIRNALMLAFLLSYAVLAPFSGFTISEIGWSTAVAAVVLLFAFTFFAFGWIGGGDAKLATLTALWFGTDHTLAYLVYTTLLGGALTFFVLQFRGLPLPAFLQKSPWIGRLHSHRSGVPYGVAMAAAGIVVFPQTRWMVSVF
jgi:prepilin peptidase CpaA